MALPPVTTAWLDVYQPLDIPPISTHLGTNLVAVSVQDSSKVVGMRPAAGKLLSAADLSRARGQAAARANGRSTAAGKAHVAGVFNSQLKQSTKNDGKLCQPGRKHLAFQW